MDVCEGMLLA